MAQDQVPELPELDHEAYLAAYWHDLGMSQPGPCGPVPLSCQEILCWCQGHGVTIQAWEFNAIRKMSQAYCQHYHQGSQSISCPSPIAQQPTEQMRDRVAKQVSLALGARARADQKKAIKKPKMKERTNP